MIVQVYKLLLETILLGFHVCCGLLDAIKLVIHHFEHAIQGLDSLLSVEFVDLVGIVLKILEVPLFLQLVDSLLIFSLALGMVLLDLRLNLPQVLNFVWELIFKIVYFLLLFLFDEMFALWFGAVDYCLDHIFQKLFVLVGYI